MSQIDEYVARQVYADYHFHDPGLRSDEIRGKDLVQAAEILGHRISLIKSQLGPLEEVLWKQEFLGKCAAIRPEVEAIWDARWTELCDGKRLFQQLFRRLRFGMSLPKFKKRVMQEMRSRRTPNWSAVESLLKRLIGG